MERAKQEMSNAGVRSASDCIEKNHYSYLKDWSYNLEQKKNIINSKQQEGQRKATYLDERINLYNQMISKVQTIMDLQHKIEKIIEASQRTHKDILTKNIEPNYKPSAKFIEIKSAH